MRMWEVEDNKAAPANLVREQDFILRIRRLHRLGLNQVIVNLVLSEQDSSMGGRGPLEEVQQRLQTFSESTGASYSEMSCGDVFLIWPDNAMARTYPNLVLNVVFPEGFAQDDIAKIRHVFILPDDYGTLREKANDYIEASRTAAVNEQVSGAAQALQGEFVRGPLTPWAVNQIEKLLNDISIRRHIRRQPLYKIGAQNKLKPVLEECFVALAELHRTYFPKLDLDTPNHLFLELCQALDRRLITGLTRNYEMIKGQRLNLNLAILSVMEPAFPHFSRMLPPAEHGLVGFELNAGDLFQDVRITQNAIATIKQEGFKVYLDGITPEMLPYVNFGLFDVDGYKINAGTDHCSKLEDPAIAKVFATLPREKIIFFHCDSKPAIEAGVKRGVTLFQGWLIDDMAKEESAP